MSTLELLRAAGPLAFLILVLGAASLWLSIAYLRKSRAADLALALGTTAATLIVGVLGTVLGFQIAMRHLSTLAAEKRYLIGIGMLESMNDLVLSLILALAATAILTFAAYRRHSAPRRIGEPAVRSAPVER